MTTRDDLEMTAGEIAAFEATLPGIEEREAKATDGPWEHGRTDLASYDGRTGNRELYVYRPGDAAHDEDIRVLGGDDPVADGVFIAHARLDIPALLRYARTLKAQLVTRRLEASLHALYSFLNAGADAGVGASVSAVVLRDAAWKAVARDLHEQTRAGAILPPQLPTSISYAGIVLLRASDVRAMVETPP